jgi:hypothetical protein
MKKLVFAAVAAIALTASVSFVSCDKKAPVAADTVAADTVAVDTVAEVVDTVAADTVAADTL